MSGASRAWASRRSAARPSSKVRNDHASSCTTSGADRTRSVSSVITPNAPSEPSTSARRSGPAADAGARPTESVPTGVAMRRATTSSSKRP
jgi:hypothetical protein